MDTELRIKIGTRARGSSVTMMIDAAVASSKMNDNTVIPTYIANAEMMVAKCCPISYKTDMHM